MAGLRHWVQQWLQWMLAPPESADSRSKQNHADFYDTMAAACAFFAGNSQSTR